MQALSIHIAAPGIHAFGRSGAAIAVGKAARSTSVTESQPSARRHPDQSLDFEFYRRRSHALRRQAMRELGAWEWLVMGLLTVAIVGLVAAASIHGSKIPAAPTAPHSSQVR